MTRRGGGVAVLVTIWLVACLTDPVKKIASQTAMLHGAEAQWLQWGAVLWMLLAFGVSLHQGKNSPWKEPINLQIAFSPYWILGWQAIGIGILLTLLTGKIRFGIGVAWVSVLWIALLVWKDTRQHKL